MLRLFIVLVAGCCLTCTAQAQEKPPEQVSLTLSPAAEPRPALKYSLWRAPRERDAGNGATFYYRAMIVAQQSRDAVQKDFPPERLEKWLSMPLAELPQEEVAAYLARHASVLEQLEKATSREDCHWDLRLDQLRGTEIVSFLLPDFQNMRELARLVAYKARYEISQRNYDDAIATLRMGYQMAHDAGEPPLLIGSLIGIAISAQMNAVALDLIDADDSPNIYWALKQLPHPLVDIRPALQFELAMPFQMFPFLADAETAQRTSQEWQRLTQETLTTLNSLATDSIKLDDWQVRLGTTALMMKAYPSAKQQLIDSGLSPELVEKMPVAQVIAIQAARNYRYTYEEVFKWTLLPYPEGSSHLRQSIAQLKKDGYMGQPLSDKEVLPIATLLLPSIENVLLASARGERRLAALETIEAIRMHAAARKGELPSSLYELARAPSAKNPFTGETFDYRHEDARAVLQERAPGVETVRAYDRDYLIELTKQVK